MEDEEAGGGEGGDADAGGVSWGWWGGVGLGISESEMVENVFLGKAFFLRGGGDARGRAGMH